MVKNLSGCKFLFFHYFDFLSSNYERRNELLFLYFTASKMSCYMNPNVDPCDQFYEYACGKWELHHPIPKDRVGYDIFEILREVWIANKIEFIKL